MRVAKVIVFLASLSPAAFLIWGLFNNGLGANPVEMITHTTGDWSLRFLLMSLSITPLRKILEQPRLIRFRRMLGLFSFFYVVLHFLTWAWLDKLFDPVEMWKDVQKRPFMTAGTVGFLCLLPLALTSTAGWIRRLGGKRWQALHRLSYAAAAAGILHYYWLVKSDVRLPVMYACIFAILMLARLWLRKPSTRLAAAGVHQAAE
jgi:sulfoxide reductase heme-binding subunit YedZ